MTGPPLTSAAAPLPPSPPGGEGKDFTRLTSTAAALLLDNVDTDTIIPSREIRTTGRTGLKDGLFAPLRYTDTDARVEDPAFVLNRPEHRGAQIGRAHV